MRETQLLEFERHLAGKRVLITGHTGFTGSWVCLWLRSIQVEVYGYALEPETDPSLYVELDMDECIDSEINDVREYEKLKAAFDKFQPELVLHLAAQPLVKRSYAEPVRTFDVNVMGTVNVLEAARTTPSVIAVLCVTTDKVYKNRERNRPYREEDPLEGKDPYSASKAAAEMAVSSYRHSCGVSEERRLAIASVRAGNIIGGGDWSEDRLVSDFVRAVVANDTITLRYPEATRPWQHVLAVVHGYLMLLSAMQLDPQKYSRAWNLGPSKADHISVQEVVDIFGKEWVRPETEYQDKPLPEASLLALDSTMSKKQLGWKPLWDCHRAIAETAHWYKEFYRGDMNTRELTMAQIEDWRAGLLSAQ